jgi:hypothetical protein
LEAWLDRLAPQVAVEAVEEEGEEEVGENKKEVKTV